MSFYHKPIKDIIAAVRSRKMSAEAAFEKLKNLPYTNLGFAKFDTHRVLRKGFPEVIYSQGKAIQHLERIVDRCLKEQSSVILTKADPGVYKRLKARHPELEYGDIAKIIYFHKKRPKIKKGFVSVVTAGTSDINAAEEAALTLEIMGNRVRRIYDVGVAGIHRVLDKRRVLNNSRAIIVAAGMEGALASVVAGLVN